MEEFKETLAEKIFGYIFDFFIYKLPLVSVIIILFCAIALIWFNDSQSILLILKIVLTSFVFAIMSIYIRKKII